MGSMGGRETATKRSSQGLSGFKDAFPLTFALIEAKASESDQIVEFADSNIIVYLNHGEQARAERARAVVYRGPSISVQVLNEVSHVCVRKMRMDWMEIKDFLSGVRHFCPVVALTEAIHDDGRRIAAQYKLAFYDACIVAAALSVQATTLWSEDMHDGQVIDRSLTIKNPFL